MSEQENLHIVQRIYQAVLECDISTRMSLVTDDLDLTFFGSEKIPWAGRWRGKDGLGRFLGRIADALEFQVFSPQEFIAAGKNVVVLGHERCRVRATGKVVDVSWAHVWTLRDGLISRHLEYSDTAAWEAGFDASGV
jgi:ketosteroid isomerase-like protein